MSACTDHRQILADWDPASDDLPDAVALHLDECPACREVHDARFAPIALDPGESAPDDLGPRLLAGVFAAVEEAPPPDEPPEAIPIHANRRHRWFVPATIAAAAVVVLTCTGSVATVVLTPGMYVAGDEVAYLGPAEQPAPGLEKGEKSPERNREISSGGESAGRAGVGSVVLEDLNALGYVDGGSVTEAGRSNESRVSARLRGADGDGLPSQSKSGETVYHVAVSTDPPAKPEPDPSGDQFIDYGVNPVQTVTSDPLSTFSVDVDTASYTFTRRTLRAGHLPPRSAVRVEEFVNYFTYDYAHPGGGDPFAVDLEAAPSPWTPGHHVVRVGLQGRRVPADQRKPVHLTFLVDTSGSMRSADKLPLVQQSLRMLVEELEDGDTVALVAYAGSAGLVLEPTPMSRRDEVIRAITRLQSGGSTAMGAGIELAYALAEQRLKPGTISRVVICSDGDANVGPSSHQGLSALVARHADQGITLTTAGFGTGNLDDPVMEQLADDGDGQYVYIDSALEARRVFVDGLTGTLEVIARDVKVQVEWNPAAVGTYRLVGYENRDVADEDFRDDAVDAGEIGAGHQVTALYEVALVPGGSGHLATVRLRSKAPGPEAPSVERVTSLSRERVRPTLAETSPSFRLAVSAASLAELLRGSPHTGELGYDRVLALARDAARPEYPADAELVELITKARALSD